jgi:transketolase
MIRVQLLLLQIPVKNEEKTVMIDMRQRMADVLETLLAEDQRLTVVLADISTTLFKPHPRIINLGIMEQTLISVAAGLALEGFIPVAHSFVPFLVERPFEQLKDDFCYQRLGGNFISIGGSYDYSSEGMTHQGPGDIQLLRGLPAMQIVVPGTAQEFEQLFRQAYANGAPTYYRLGLRSNKTEQHVDFGKLTLIKRGTAATVIAVGPLLEDTLQAVADLDVTVLYCTTVAPFDSETLRRECQGGQIVLVEPYYEGGLTMDIMAAMQRQPVAITTIGIPREVLTHYGTPQQHDEALGLTPHGIRQRILEVLGA